MMQFVKCFAIILISEIFEQDANSEMTWLRVVNSCLLVHVN